VLNYGFSELTAFTPV